MQTTACSRYACCIIVRFSPAKVSALTLATAARDVAGKLVGIASLGMPDAAAAELLTELTAAFPSTSATGAAQKGGNAMPLKFEGQDGSMAAAGYLLAQAATGVRRQLPGSLPEYAHSVTSLLDICSWHTLRHAPCAAIARFCSIMQAYS